MNSTDLNLQLAFIGVTIIAFFLAENVFPKRQEEPSIAKAILMFFAAAVAQLIVTWVGNMFDSPTVWLVAHIVSGGILGVGLRFAVQFLPGKNGPDQAR